MRNPCVLALVALGALAFSVIFILEQLAINPASVEFGARQASASAPSRSVLSYTNNHSLDNAFPIKPLKTPPWFHLRSAQLPCDLDIYHAPPEIEWKGKRKVQKDSTLPTIFDGAGSKSTAQPPSKQWISNDKLKDWKSPFDLFLRYWYVPSHDADEQLFMSELIDQERPPLECNNFIMTSLPRNWIGSKYRSKAMKDMIQHNIHWVKSQENLCYINAFYTCQPFPPYPQPDAHDSPLEDLTTSLLYSPRYWALPLWSQLVREGKKVRRTSSRPPFIHYIDYDLVFTNKSFTFERLLDRVERGMTLGHTAETRRYPVGYRDSYSLAWGPESQYPDSHLPPPDFKSLLRKRKSTKGDGTHNLSSSNELISTDEVEESDSNENMMKKSPVRRLYEPKLKNLGINDMAFMIAMDVYCSSAKWLLNSGSLLFQPSKTAEFIMESTVALTNYTATSMNSYLWDPADQGRVTWILREAFDMDDHRLREMCEELDPLSHACSGDEIVMLRKINMTRIYNSNNVLKYPAYRVFGTEEQALQYERESQEPKYIAIVCSRWINSGAAEHHYKMWSAKRQEQWAYHCGDYSAHFYGGNKDGFDLQYFRHHAMETSKCVADWPTADKDFDPKAFVNQAHPGGEPRPRERYKDPYLN